jgi:hypothetical protein
MIFKSILKQATQNDGALELAVAAKIILIFGLSIFKKCKKKGILFIKCNAKLSSKHLKCNIIILNEC